MATRCACQGGHKISRTMASRKFSIKKAQSELPTALGGLGAMALGGVINGFLPGSNLVKGGIKLALGIALTSMTSSKLVNGFGVVMAAQGAGNLANAILPATSQIPGIGQGAFNSAWASNDVVRVARGVGAPDYDYGNIVAV